METLTRLTIPALIIVGLVVIRLLGIAHRHPEALCKALPISFVNHRNVGVSVQPSQIAIELIDVGVCLTVEADDAIPSLET